MRLLTILLLLAVPAAALPLPSPAVTSIYPPSGSINGGTQVTIRGTFFQHDATVTIGGVALTNVVRIGPGLITGITGPRIRGVVNIVVTNPDGGTSRLAKAYTYTDGTCCWYPSFVLTPLTGATGAASVAVGAFSPTSNDIASAPPGATALFEGNATPSFTAVQTFPSAGNVSCMEVVDVNGDGIEDVAMAPLGGAITVFHGHATAPFIGTSSIPNTAFAFGLESGDFNEDGVPDFAVADHFSANGEVKICLGILGGSGCAATSTYSVGANAAGVTAADFNGDQHLDLAASDEAAGTVTILLGSGNGSFTAGSPIPAGTCVTTVMHVAAGYLDADAVLDLAVATGAILLGNGNGTFTPGTPIPAGNGRHVAIADFNSDGFRDVAIDSSQTSVNIHLGDGNGGFVRGPVIAAAGGIFDAFVPFDIEGDGMVDLAIGGSPVVAKNTVTLCSAITVAPSALPEAATGEAFNVAFTQSGGSGTVTFTLSGNLPDGLGFVNGALSGTPTELGSFPLTITAFDGNGCSGSKSYTLNVLLPQGSAPGALVATADSAGSVQLSWVGVKGADHYEVWRREHGQAFHQVGSPVANSFTNLVPSGTTYIYRVHAVHGVQTSGASNPDIATTIFFTDALAPGVTPVKAVHLLELRTAVNAVRDAAGLPSTSFADPSPLGVGVKAAHVQQLRNALDVARGNIGLPAFPYTHLLLAGSSDIHAIDFAEIRVAVE